MVPDLLYLKFEILMKYFTRFGFFQNFTAEEMAQYFGEAMSFDSGRGNSSAGRSSSVTTSPSMSLTPGENTLFHGFDWSSNSESNSPKSSMFCEANLNDYEYPQ